MYLHLGQDTVIKMDEIIGIFDMDTATVSADTKNFLKRADRLGVTEALFDEVPKSFLLTDDGKVYFSQISTQSLVGRIE